MDFSWIKDIYEGMNGDYSLKASDFEKFKEEKKTGRKLTSGAGNSSANGGTQKTNYAGTPTGYSAGSSSAQANSKPPTPTGTTDANGKAVRYNADGERLNIKFGGKGKIPENVKQGYKQEMSKKSGNLKGHFTFVDLSNPVDLMKIKDGEGGEEGGVASLPYHTETVDYNPYEHGQVKEGVVTLTADGFAQEDGMTVSTSYQVQGVEKDPATASVSASTSVSQQKSLARQNDYFPSPKRVEERKDELSSTNPNVLAQYTNGNKGATTTSTTEAKPTTGTDVPSYTDFYTGAYSGTTSDAAYEALMGTNTNQSSTFDYKAYDYSSYDYSSYKSPFDFGYSMPDPYAPLERGADPYAPYFGGVTATAGTENKTTDSKKNTLSTNQRMTDQVRQELERQLKLENRSQDQVIPPMDLRNDTTDTGSRITSESDNDYLNMSEVQKYQQELNQHNEKRRQAHQEVKQQRNAQQNLRESTTELFSGLADWFSGATGSTVAGNARSAQQPSSQTVQTHHDHVQVQQTQTAVTTERTEPVQQTKDFLGIGSFFKKVAQDFEESWGKEEHIPFSSKKLEEKLARNDRIEERFNECGETSSTLAQWQEKERKIQEHRRQEEEEAARIAENRARRSGKHLSWDQEQQELARNANSPEMIRKEIISSRNGVANSVVIEPDRNANANIRRELTRNELLQEFRNGQIWPPRKDGTCEITTPTKNLAQEQRTQPYIVGYNDPNLPATNPNSPVLDFGRGTDERNRTQKIPLPTAEPSKKSKVQQYIDELLINRPEFKYDIEPVQQEFGPLGVLGLGVRSNNKNDSNSKVESYKIKGRLVKLEFVDGYLQSRGVNVKDGPMTQGLEDYLDGKDNGVYDQSNLDLGPSSLGFNPTTNSRSSLQGVGGTGGASRMQRISFNDSDQVYNRIEAMRVAKEQAKARERGDYSKYVEWHGTALKKDAPIDAFGNKVEPQCSNPSFNSVGVGVSSYGAAVEAVGNANPEGLPEGVVGGNDGIHPRLGNIYLENPPAARASGTDGFSQFGQQYGIQIDIPTSYELPASMNPYTSQPKEFEETERQPTQVLCPSQAVVPPGNNKIPGVKMDFGNWRLKK